VTPTLSDAAFQVSVTWPVPALPFRLFGALGATVSSTVAIAVLLASDRLPAASTARTV